MNYSFIGVGNMAGAIIKGMTAGCYTGNYIYGYNRTRAKTDALRDLCGIHSCETMEEAVMAADVLILSVKPQVIDSVLNEIKDYLKGRKILIVSLAVGKTISYLEDKLGIDLPIIRVMPNINAKVNASTSGYCCNKITTLDQKRMIEDLFSTVGTVTEMEEKDFSIFAAIAGSSPAFAYLYIDALARAAQKAGMGRELALTMAAQSALGSAKMILESEEDPWLLINQVCSPGGTTIEGVATLQANCFEGTITKAFDAVIAKEKEIQRK